MSNKRLFLKIPVAAAAMISPLSSGLFASTQDRSSEDAFPSLSGATEWLNSSPLSAEALRGKVVLVEFWTYSCINWRREYPYVRAWAAKYRDAGLVVIGVHTPEFEFEKDMANVRRAVKDIGIEHPVAVDSNREIWRAFKNGYWPALYFIDAQGRVRHRHHGEGRYDQSERVIQKLLVEAGAAGIGQGLVNLAPTGAEAQPDWANIRSPENYVGYARTQGLASIGAEPDKRRTYDAPRRLRLNQWALVGEWTLQEEAAVLSKGGGRIAYNFHARDLHMVMGSAIRGQSVQIRVSIDGEAPGAAHGVDVDEQGRGIVSEHRMYQLVRQTKPIADRRFEIEFLGSDVEVFSFTFG